MLGLQARRTLPHPVHWRKGPQNPPRPFLVGGTALYFSLSISFDFICSMQLFTLSSESVSLPYLFLNLWALVQTLADLYLNVFSTLSRTHYSRAGGFAVSISFQKFFPFCTCGKSQLFRNANYWSRVMMFPVIEVSLHLPYALTIIPQSYLRS